ncbi:anhydro-N-acetylmuramic acid kinase [Georgenia satyanarayanai]|uniref:Anhydro-N-acetylmuramic acid kinase n=1 Tax=Georgenia satyanarayanai TaxID=860221 RepID=A0A2Y9BV27_9MICO|nr:anhydro-N-acetylmuramic acid kinase [Georgenia satyanarayanai]PYG01839.1 anhydro-N-acetylmuramic acid kinase [Georgenia satyanarayanai]SSA36642.1 anhydro-N-acetylmuramic acid kinase [Georgenia satyanarayanai]
MRVLGMISGTSHDGIDVAVVDYDVDDDDATALVGTVLHTGSAPYEPGLRARLLAALPPAGTTLAEVCELDTLIGQAFAAAAAGAIAAAGPVDLICSHGQTVYHWVEGGRALGTLQLGQPAWVAEATGVPVVADVRARDVAAGGHGAPLVSFLDSLVLADGEGTAAALNLGGIANITVVGPRGVLAYDTGPANALLDVAILDRGAHPAGYDAGGAIAATGTVDEDLLALLLRDDYYAQPAPKSTGKELFHAGYLRAALEEHGRELSTPDLLATLTALTARTVADELRAHGVTRVLASGGGAANPTMLRMLAKEVPGVEVLTTDVLGLPADAKEAIAFALFGWCTAHGLPATVPSATGARGARILGSITPGAGPLRLPEPVAQEPRRLRLRTATEGAR